MNYYWMKCQGRIADPTAHSMALAFLSDSMMIITATFVAGYRQSDTSMIVSLDHNVYFHAPVKADEWLLYELESPWAGDERGLVIGRFFSIDGIHVATVIQEGVIRLSPSGAEKAKRQSALVANPRI